MAFVQNSSNDSVVGSAAEPSSRLATPPSLPPAQSQAKAREDARGEAQRRHANDDAQLVGDMLRSLQYQPSLWPYLLALIASAIYVGALVGVARFDLTSFTPDSEGLLKGAIASCPFVLFFLLAAFSRQVLRVRHSADAMARVAFRLVTPATSAQDDLVSLSQTVRMEVASLGDGIERGILRIGDMELVASDLLRRLEQAYASADAKMHSLTRRLTNERESLEAYAERVGDTILNSRKQIDLDLKMAGEQISSRVRETALEIMSGVEEHARAAIGEAEDALEVKARELGVLLESYSTSVRVAAQQANGETEAMRERLVTQSVENIKFLKEVLAASEREFALMQEKVVQSFGARSGGIAQAMQESEQSFVLKADELLHQLHWFEGNAMARLDVTSDEIRAAGETLTGSLDGFEGKISEMSFGAKMNIEALAASVQAKFEEQISQFDSHAGRNISILNETLNAGIKGVNTTLLDGLRDFNAALGEAKTGEEMRAAVGDLRNILQTGLGEFRGEFTQVCEALSSLFVSSSDRVAEDVIRASEVTVARVQDAGARLAASVQDTGALVVSDLSGLNRDLLKSIDEAAIASAKTVHDAARQPLSDIQRENQRVKDETISSLRKLSELNTVIRSTIASAEKRIGSVSHSLVNQTEIFLKLVEGSRVQTGEDMDAVRAPVSQAPIGESPDAAFDMIRGLQSMAELTEAHRAAISRLDEIAEDHSETLDEPLEEGGQAPVVAAAYSVPDAAPLPARDSPEWMSSLLARASRSEHNAQAIKTPDHVAEVVHLDFLGESLAAFARGDLTKLDEAIYKPAGLSIFRRIQARYKSEAAFRVSADRMATTFNETFVSHIGSGVQILDWTDFIEDNLAGLMTAHATGAFQG